MAIHHPPLGVDSKAPSINLIQQQVLSFLMTHQPRETMPKVERQTLRTIKAERDIFILPADKRCSTVVLDREKDFQKAKNLREDQFGCNNVIWITHDESARQARFYSLPKMSKEGALLRPIVSLKGAPAYALTKLLFRSFSFRTADSGTVACSSTQFLEENQSSVSGRTSKLTVYEQAKETPMGSPISGLIAEAVLKRVVGFPTQQNEMVDAVRG
ncbi:unnamed protein product [Dibothriocephalus latus]|uniref:Uncharacterized protein n=1 Tax=Dibothriocephalus latus TaxID=60516 RepID=A0A3P7LEF2_DIBLA|nr:unnamed protein product [Dibothriocephalus latus]